MPNIGSIQEQVGLRIRAARFATGFTNTKQFAQKHNLLPSTYSQHETGKRTINIETLVKYAEILTVSPGWLLTGTGPVCTANAFKKNKLISSLKN